MAERGDGPPGTYMPEILSILTKELGGYQATLDQVWKNDLPAVNAELARLKREVSRLSQENQFLKKAAAYFAKEPK